MDHLCASNTDLNPTVPALTEPPVDSYTVRAVTRVSIVGIREAKSVNSDTASIEKSSVIGAVINLDSPFSNGIFKYIVFIYEPLIVLFDTLKLKLF